MNLDRFEGGLEQAEAELGGQIKIKDFVAEVDLIAPAIGGERASERHAGGRVSIPARRGDWRGPRSGPTVGGGAPGGA